MRLPKSLFLPLLALGALITAPAQAANEGASIAVGQAKIRKTVLALPSMIARTPIAGLQGAPQTIVDTVKNHLLFMDLFLFLDSKAFIEPAGAGITLDKFRLSDWASIKSDFVIKTAIERQGNSLVMEAYVYDTGTGKTALAKRYTAEANGARNLAKTFANDIVTALTGLPGIFQTKIAMVCEKVRGKKEIFVMDFDGTNVQQITNHRSLAISPAWSPDGTKIAYSLFTKRRDNTRNIDLYEYDFRTKNVRLLSNRRGINSGAAYSPDGKKIALTMSFLGNPEVFALDTGTSEVSRLTSSPGVDVDPTWSPDGRQMAFVSSRAGQPMVYKMGIDGTSITRLTYAGRYNATPTWSPRNNKIGFAGWIDGRFDLFIMNPDGSNIERLSKNQGNNEDPNFSPDGNFIVFSSSRVGGKNIYVTNVDGTFTRRLTFGLGNCVAPRWSNPPR